VFPAKVPQNHTKEEIMQRTMAFAFGLAALAAAPAWSQHP